MADEFLTRVGAWNTTILSLQAADTLTAAYQTSTNTVDVRGFNLIRLHLGYVKGTEATVQVLPEGYDGASWIPLGHKAVQGSGVSELTKDIIQLTPGNFDASDSIVTPEILVGGLQKVRVKYKCTTPGGAAGTLAIGVTGGVSSVE